MLAGSSAGNPKHLLGCCSKPEVKEHCQREKPVPGKLRKCMQNVSFSTKKEKEKSVALGKKTKQPKYSLILQKLKSEFAVQLQAW